MWKFKGQTRPAFALIPGPGQESVWDYPRPPVLVPDSREVVVRWGDVILARTSEAIRVLETASPPTFYLPPAAVAIEHLRSSVGQSFCEWKGAAMYWSLIESATGESTGHVKNVGWSYAKPTPPFSQIAGYFSFYPALVQCSVAGESVRPQPGGFYGGWLTDEIVGPVKGDPGTSGW